MTENNLLDENRIVNVQGTMRQLLQGCGDCGNELKLTCLISETKSGLGSYISCECGVINTICSGKRHPDVNTDKIQPWKVFDINTKTVLGELSYSYCGQNTAFIERNNETN